MRSIDASERLNQYRALLQTLRQQASTLAHLPALRFFLFGMGPRRKMIYQQGVLKDALTGEILRQWDVADEIILPPEYCVSLLTRQGATVQIVEDKTGVWLDEGGVSQLLSQGAVCLPTFSGHPYAPILRVLHHEILINLVDGRPLPNFFVYPRPWYRDGAMMAMVLQQTGNLALIRDWILGLSSPYDRNNAGECEADNLGQTLYLISLVSDASHPLVPQIIKELEKHRVGGCILGRSDFAEHPVYQTQWACFGLDALCLPNPYRVPHLYDAYASLFWWGNSSQHVPGPRFEQPDYPYLEWAEAHFYRQERVGPLGDQDYPLSWEANASQANFPALNVLSPLYAQRKLSAPHTWHAAEMFLSLFEKTGKL